MGSKQGIFLLFCVLIPIHGHIQCAQKVSKKIKKVLKIDVYCTNKTIKLGKCDDSDLTSG